MLKPTKNSTFKILRWVWVIAMIMVLCLPTSPATTYGIAVLLIIGGMGVAYYYLYVKAQRENVALQQVLDCVTCDTCAYLTNAASVVTYCRAGYQLLINYEQERPANCIRDGGYRPDPVRSVKKDTADVDIDAERPIRRQQTRWS